MQAPRRGARGYPPRMSAGDQPQQPPAPPGGPPRDPFAEARESWERHADFFDELWGDEGDDYHQKLFAPAAERLLGLQRGHRVVEFACGNGAFARRLAAEGIEVSASDVSAPLIEAAERRTGAAGIEGIEFSVVDACDEMEVRRIGALKPPFDAAACIMGVMSMPALRPMFGGAHRIVKPRGAFAVVTLHPAFATSAVSLSKGAEDADEDDPRAQDGVRVTRYLSRYMMHGITSVKQPERQLYFHRPLSELLADAFAAGWTLDGAEELPAAGAVTDSPLIWGKLPEIPMALALRFRKPA